MFEVRVYVVTRITTLLLCRYGVAAAWLTACRPALTRTPAGLTRCSPAASRAQPGVTSPQPHTAAVIACSIRKQPSHHQRPGPQLCRSPAGPAGLAPSSPSKGPLACPLVRHTSAALQACHRPPQASARGNAGGHGGNPARSRLGDAITSRDPKRAGPSHGANRNRPDARGRQWEGRVLGQPPAMEEGPQRRFRGRCWGLWLLVSCSCEMPGVLLKEI